MLIRTLDDSGLLPDSEGEQTVYLVPQFGDDAEARQVLQEVFSTVFESELYAWHTDETGWPKKRTFAVFREWFTIEMHSMVVDLCSYPIEEDEDDDDPG